jgi:leucyl-tRNA synthetase
MARQVIKHGKAMSKSLGNGVELGEQIERFGAALSRARSRGDARGDSRPSPSAA